jgi:hypothetical protein
VIYFAVLISLKIMLRPSNVSEEKEMNGIGDHYLPAAANSEIKQE